MNNNFQFDFIADKVSNTILENREFAAELPLVWDAFTKPEIGLHCSITGNRLYLLNALFRSELTIA